jgi:hypothetical protein
MQDPRPCPGWFCECRFERDPGLHAHYSEHWSLGMYSENTLKHSSLGIGKYGLPPHLPPLPHCLFNQKSLSSDMRLFLFQGADVDLIQPVTVIPLT